MTPDNQSLSRLCLPRVTGCTAPEQAGEKGKKKNLRLRNTQRRGSQRIKLNECTPQRWPCEEMGWPQLPDDRGLFSPLTSAEQATGKLLQWFQLSLKMVQMQAILSRPQPHECYNTQVQDVLHAGILCGCWTLPLLWGLWAGKQLLLAVRVRDQPELWLQPEMHLWKIFARS